MSGLHIFLAAFLLSGHLGVWASHHHDPAHNGTQHSAHHENGKLENSYQSQTTYQNSDGNSARSHITNFDNMDMSNHTIVPLDDVVFGLSQNSIVHLSNLELLVPNHLNLGEMDPDFSRMILDVHSIIGSFEMRSDYSIYISNYMALPLSSQGKIYIDFKNVTAIGRTALALTPAAFLALNFDLTYNPEIISVKVVPQFIDIVTDEVRLSKDLVGGVLSQIINQKLENNLNYYVETHINLLLSKISVFTVGHKNERSFGTEHSKQNVKIGDLFDELLDDVKREIVLNKKDKISTPDFHRNFSEKLEADNINGTFSAKEGWVSGLSTLKRASNVSLSKKEHVFILSASIEFESLNMGYDNYEAKFLKTEVNGTLDGSFLHKMMTIKVTMTPHEDGTCTSTLGELRMFRINGYRIENISNIGSMEWLQRRINNWLIGFFQVSIAKNVEKELSAAVHSSFSHFDCGEYLPHLRILI